MSEIVARERASDPHCQIDLRDLGGCEYLIEVTSSPSKNGVDADLAALAELSGEPGARACAPNVRSKATCNRVDKAWQAWR